MPAALLLAIATAAGAAAAPGVQRAADGRLLSASGLGEPPRGATAGEAARAFAALRAHDLGLEGRHGAVTEREPAGGGAVLMRRTVDGVPVLNGTIRVLVDGAGSVRAVRASDVPPRATGSFALSGAEAAARATAALGPAARFRGAPAVRRGWWASGSATRAVYQVDAVAETPSGAWRTVVDAATGEVIFRRNLRLDAAQGRVFDLSPVETTGGAACPFTAGTQSYAECAAPGALRDLPDLTSASALTGSQVQVWNCKGTQFPTAPGTTAACVQSAAPDANGVFDFAPDDASTTDEFAAVMAYYHLDRHFTFVKSLDAAIAPALKAIPAFVNAFDGTQQQPFGPYENAHFDPLLGGMVFGQGQRVDYAYDASVAYHEQDHGVVFALGDFGVDLDAQGALSEPGAVNEGVADALAVAHTGKPQVGFYIANHDAAATGTGQPPFLRDLANAKTCQGTGASVTRFGAPAIDGLDGELHDDGEIWGGFYWEVSQGLRAAGVKGCGGACDAAAAIQLQAISIAAGGSPTLKSFAQDFVDAANAAFPTRPEVGSYASCVVHERGLDACDRTLNVYGGEQAVQAVQFRYSPFQYVVTVTQAPTTVRICSANGTSAKLWASRGQKVQLTAFPQAGPATAPPGTLSFPLSAKCSSDPAVAPDTVTLTSAGTYYLLFDDEAAFEPGFELFLVSASRAGFSARPAAQAPAACTFGASAAGGAPDAGPGAGASAGSGGSTGGGGGCGLGGTGLALLALVPLWLWRRRGAGARA